MIRIGIVGCGRILAAHLRGYQLLRAAGVDDFRITALCARRREDAESYLRRGSGPAQRAPVGTNPADPLSAGDLYLSDFQPDVEPAVYTDYREMIAAGPVDAVNDFTTHALHHQVAEVAFSHGKHLLTQKPVAVSLAAARKMSAAAEARGVTWGVFENARNRADTRQLGWLFRSGHLGRLQLVLLANVGNWWAPDRIVAHTPWRHRRDEGGGITLDIGVHLFHHLRYVAGEVETVEARSEVLEPVRTTRDASGRIVQQVDCDADDTMIATFHTANGVTGILTASWAGHGRPTLTAPGRGLIYYATRGSVTAEEITLDGGQAHSLDTLYREQSSAEERSRHFPLGLTDSFALNQYDWLQAIREKREPETSGRDGLRDLAVSMAVLESSTLGRRVSVDEVLAGQVREYQRPIDERFGLMPHPNALA
jgi:predicted dehydrogenase